MKNYVLCTTLEEQSLNTLKRAGANLDLNNAKVHIVTIFEIKVFNVDIIPYIYPTEDQYPALENSAKMLMKSLADSLGLNEKNVELKCFFELSREEKIKKYLNEVKADLVVTATQGKHGIEGFFSSSFTEYLCKFSPCDVVVLRPLGK